MSKLRKQCLGGSVLVFLWTLTLSPTPVAPVPDTLAPSASAPQSQPADELPTDFVGPGNDVARPSTAPNARAVVPALVRPVVAASAAEVAQLAHELRGLAGRIGPAGIEAWERKVTELRQDRATSAALLAAIWDDFSVEQREGSEAYLVLYAMGVTGHVSSYERLLEFAISDAAVPDPDPAEHDIGPVDQAAVNRMAAVAAVERVVGATRTPELVRRFKGDLYAVLGDPDVDKSVVAEAVLTLKRHGHRGPEHERHLAVLLGERAELAVLTAVQRPPEP